MRDPNDVKIREVLDVYLRERRETAGDFQRILSGIKPLRKFWGSSTLGDIKGANCRGYVEFRNVGSGTVRRELSILSAAIKVFIVEVDQLSAIPKLWMPSAPPPKEQWLTRPEVARLLAAAMGCTFTKSGDNWTRERDINAANPALARFIILGVGTGTRHSALLGLEWEKNERGGHVDLSAENLFRTTGGKAETKKRQPPTRLGTRLLSHLGRWKAQDTLIRHTGNIIHNDRAAIERMRTPWNEAVQRAGLDHVTPHIMRHTRATWLMQAGVAEYEAAGSLGMTVETFHRIYAHHSPDFQKNAANI